MAQTNPRQVPNEAEVLGWMESLSNWGRWGDDDQLGCLNLITGQTLAVCRVGTRRHTCKLRPPHQHRYARRCVLPSPTIYGR